MEQSLYSPSIAPTITDVEEIVINHQDGHQFIHKLSHSLVTLGRDNDNDIVLLGTAVSRHHARAEWRQGVWYVTDLGSTNGSILGGDTLRAEMTQMWSLNQSLKIGEYTLQLRRKINELHDRTQFILPAELPPTVTKWRKVLSVPDEDRFTLNMWPTSVRNAARVCVAVQNEGNEADQFLISLIGDEFVQFSIHEWNTRIEPGMEKREFVGVRARHRHWLGGRRAYPFEVRVQSSGGTQHAVAGKVEVEPMLRKHQLKWTIALTLLLGSAVALLATFTNVFGFLGI